MIASPTLLRELLRYEPSTGMLFWNERPVEMFEDGKNYATRACRRWNSCYSGKEALATVTSTGYKTGKIFYRPYFAHRVIWAIVHGEWPSDQIDHINHNRTDNRIGNLREATNLDNSRNQGLSRKNTSGVCGVVFDKDHGKWRAQIRFDHKNKYLGLFDQKGDAIDARRAAEKTYNYHPNHGRDGRGSSS